MAQMQRDLVEKTRRGGDFVEADAMIRGADEFERVAVELFAPPAPGNDA
ncbi:hypothetical protein [Bosea sp. BK604]|nr:hypothetical protein [Bosea sp. BK604]